MLKTSGGYGVLAAGLLTLVVLATGCPTDPGTAVFFDDPNLEKAVRDELDHPFGILTEADLLELTHLNAKGRGIVSLSGLEFCANLKWLDLDTNAISDLTALKDLTEIQVLNLDSNEIFDISPLAGLFLLDSLSLFDNQVGDIQALVTNANVGGLGEGDFVILDSSTLSDQALSVQVPALEAAGVNVVLAIAAS